MRVGIFDSGIGGINVLKELIKKYPNNQYIYYGDTLNLPYGSKSVDELKKFACNIIDFLLKQKVDMIIVACGTISSNCFDYLSSKYDIPMYDIISPTIRYITKAPYNNIGVIATERTVESKIFEQSDKVKMVKATKRFVKIIEDEIITKSEKQEIKFALKCFKNKVDSLVLGCTHYPFISNIITNYLHVPLIDMGECLANELEISKAGNQVIELYFSRINRNLEKNVKKILNTKFRIHRLIVNKK